MTCYHQPLHQAWAGAEEGEEEGEEEGAGAEVLVGAGVVVGVGVGVKVLAVVLHQWIWECKLLLQVAEGEVGEGVGVEEVLCRQAGHAR